jgi:cephalosporin hydroxylase
LTEDAVTAWARRHRCSDWEMRCLLDDALLLGRIFFSVVLEIGNFEGDSLRIWRERLNPELLVGVQDTDELSAETAEELGVVAITGKSQDPETYERVLDALGGRKISLLYIDGDHSYDAVKRDWELYTPLVASRGVVVLHDAARENNPSVEVFKFWPEAREGRRSALLWDADPGDNTYGTSTGMGVVYW